jgi:hypothetical protein
LRKHLIWALGLVFALASVGIASAVPNTQTITGTVTPKKLPKSGAGKAIKLKIDVASTNSGNANQVPNPTTDAKVDFDKDITYQQKGFPTCDTSGFTAATTADQAKSDCGDAAIGTGSSAVEVPTATGAPPLQVPATVSAFNGKGKGIILFTYNSLSGGTVLNGKIGKSSASGYGLTLDVTVPPLAGGTAVIQEFNATIKKTYNYKGKKKSILSSTCKDKKLKFQARFTDNKGQIATGTGSQSCKQSGAKKK